MAGDEVPKNIWLTTERVIQEYGFDPTPYIEQEMAPNRRLIRSCLITCKRRCENNCPNSLRRVWLIDDIPSVAKFDAERREVLHQRELIKKYTASYTKGLKK